MLRRFGTASKSHRQMTVRCRKRIGLRDRGLVVDDREASALEVRETVPHGLQLLGRVAHPVHELTDNLDGLPSAVGPRGIAWELLVRHVGVVLQGTQQFHDVDLPLETFDAPTRFAVFWQRLYARTAVPKGEARFLAQADNLRLETTRGYALPTAADRQRAINSLPIDR